jgi:hypothetical protein
MVAALIWCGETEAMRTEHVARSPGSTPFDLSTRRGRRLFGSWFVRVIVVTLVLLSGAALGPPAVQAGNITYLIQNYPADQNGLNLSGQIVTDGATGSLSASDIISWTYTITGVGTFSGDNTIITLQGLTATTTQHRPHHFRAPSPAIATTNSPSFPMQDLNSRTTV